SACSMMRSRSGSKSSARTSLFRSTHFTAARFSAFKVVSITELPRERWVMWHSIRRKWATERRGYPVRDVMEAGGWKNEETLLRSYQQPDAETVKRVVLHPTQRIVSC